MQRVLGADLEQVSMPLPLSLGSLPGSPSPQASMALTQTWIPTPDLYMHFGGQPDRA